MKQRTSTMDPTGQHSPFGRLLGACAVAAALLAPSNALAQADLAPPPPDILLLVDTSGSMDYKRGSTSFPTCSYAGTTTTGQPSERSRWIDLVEVLTGSIKDYQCQRLDRGSTAFKTEYALGGNPPYDFLYPNPYHRPASDKCVVGPGTLTSDPYAFPATAIATRTYDTNAACSFQQSADGVLDAFANDVRFGLMTFDTEPSSNTDVSGLWSYYVNGPVQGKPLGCPALQDQEVGARNASAPPWEGRAVGFGNPVGTIAQQLERNAWIQKILLATRPYGATPIAGMLNDARQYFLEDTSNDPIGTTFPFGPKDDDATCRRKAIILLSDGQPNMDLRPFCEGSGSACPYDKSEDIAANLKENGIDIYVIGFGLSTFTVGGVPKSCATDITGVALNDPAGLCATNNDPNLQACCALNRIAQAGGHAPVDNLDADWRYAHFADDRETLRNALSLAIGANFPPTSRTPSVQASGSSFILRGSDLTFARGFRFGAAFEPGTAGQGWVGSLKRSRYLCEDQAGVKVPVLQEPKLAEGDDFVANVNKSGPTASSRVIYTALSTSGLQTTLRPNLAPADNEGVGTQTATLSKHGATDFVSAVSADHMELIASSCDSNGVSISRDACRDRVLKWLVGLDNGTIYNRCPNAASGACSLVGDFFHSAPRPVSGRPSALLNDASYDAFIAAQETAKRPSVLYASSNDGFLHAFKMAPVGKVTDSEVMSTRTLETNQLWSFVPPGVIPDLIGSYPGTHQLLLDGTPAIKDVVATEITGATGDKFELQRAATDAEAGAGAWRTILVQSYGAQRPGYFAIDITDPVPSDTGGPKFLWQLVTDETNTNQLFGSGGGTPLITTIFLDGFEVAVAVLPGGYGAPADSSSTCTRTFDSSAFQAEYMPRTDVRCYSAESAKLARSLTIVRLDTGKVLRTFRRDPDEVPKLRDALLVTTAHLDAPITGQPVPFPSEVGAIADRIFIGDQDGGLWRVNLAGAPEDWTMDLFFDTFPNGGTFGHEAEDGQPIITPPIISVDQRGNLTVAVSTGDQEALSGTPVNYVWSLVETPNDERTKFTAVPKWHLDFKDSDAGFRVIGTMALFSGNLYFAAMNRPENGQGACSQGVGRVYAMHYLEPHASGDAGKGGRVDKTFVGTTSTLDYLPSSVLTGGTAEAFLGGVSIGQQPTCENLGTTTDDEYFQYGTHNSLGSPTTGKFQLFVSTGNTPTNPTREGITAVDQGGAQAAAVDLENPAVVTRVDSWAAIVE